MNKKIQLLSAIFPILIVLFTFCSCRKELGEVDQDKIFPVYDVQFIETDSNITTIASARVFSDSTEINWHNLKSKSSRSDLILPDESISYNGTFLGKDSTRVPYILFPWASHEVPAFTPYQYVFSEYLPERDFELTDANNRTYINILPRIHEIAPTDSVITLQHGIPTVISWEGLPVQEDETVGLLTKSDVSFSFAREILVERETASDEGTTGLTIMVKNRDTTYIIENDTMGMDTFFWDSPDVQRIRFYRETFHQNLDNPNGEPTGGAMRSVYCSREFRIEVVQ